MPPGISRASPTPLIPFEETQDLLPDLPETPKVSSKAPREPKIHPGPPQDPKPSQKPSPRISRPSPTPPNPPEEPQDLLPDLPKNPKVFSRTPPPRSQLTNQHPVLVGVPGVLDDGDDVGAFLGHVDEVPAGAVGKLHGVDQALLEMGMEEVTPPPWGLQTSPGHKATTHGDIPGVTKGEEHLQAMEPPPIGTSLESPRVRNIWGTSPGHGTTIHGDFQGGKHLHGNGATTHGDIPKVTKVGEHLQAMEPPPMGTSLVSLRLGNISRTWSHHP